MAIQVVALFALNTLASTSSTYAMPARVTVFEALVYERPDTASRVLERLVEGTDVSVDEQSESGWRKVRMRDGKRVGWIQDKSLGLASSEPEPTQPSAPHPVRETPAAEPGPIPKATIIRSFRASLYAEATKESDLLEYLSKDAAVEPIEPPTGGWQKVKTLTGTIGWLSITDLATGPPEGFASSRPAAPRPTSPTPPSSGYPGSPGASDWARGWRNNTDIQITTSMPEVITSLSMLKRRIQSEPSLARKLEAMQEGTQTATWISLGSGVLALVLLVAAVSDNPPNVELAVLGSVSAVVSVGAVFFVFPSRDDIHEVVNDWNRLRPAEPIYWKEAPMVNIFNSTPYRPYR